MRVPTTGTYTDLENGGPLTRSLFRPWAQWIKGWLHVLPAMGVLITANCAQLYMELLLGNLQRPLQELGGVWGPCFRDRCGSHLWDPRLSDIYDICHKCMRGEYPILAFKMFVTMDSLDRKLEKEPNESLLGFLKCKWLTLVRYKSHPPALHIWTLQKDHFTNIILIVNLTSFFN